MKKTIIIVIVSLLTLSTFSALYISRKQYDSTKGLIGNDVVDTSQIVTKEPSNELAGSWFWQSSMDASGEEIIPEDVSKFIITFTTDGRLNSTTDCNSVSGSFVTNGEVISVGPLISTRMACINETLESTYTSQLALSSSYTISGETLKINLLKDAGVMVFARQ